LTFDGLIETKYTLKSQYRPRGRWVPTSLARSELLPVSRKPS
jgi:hypothetical protein